MRGTVAGKMKSGFASAGRTAACVAIFHFSCNKSLYYRGGNGSSRFSVAGSQWATATRLKGRTSNVGVQGGARKIF